MSFGIPVRNGLGLGLLASTSLATANAAVFSPASLFAAGEQGVWYDPSDLTTLFQDSAGTTPVTAVEQPVGRMLDKSGRGNHATQSTSAARPVLSARVNLLTKTEAFDDVAWTKTNISISANATVAPDGTTTADKMVENSANAARGQFFTASTTVASGQVTWSVYLKAAERQFGGLTAIDPSNGRYYLVADLTNGAEIASGVANGSPSLVSKSITSVGNGWYRLQIILNCAAGSANVWFYPQDDASFVTNTTGNAVYQGDGTSGTFVWGADLRVANDGVGIPVYQRVNVGTPGSSTTPGTADYDTTGFPLYLRFDGVDDSMATGSINFTATNKMTVFGGARKLTDTANIISELSANVGANAGSFYFVSGIDGSAPAGYTFLGRGVASAGIPLVAYVSPAVTAPNTSVLAMTGDIPGDLNTIRRNTVLGVNATGDQGVGNYGNYPLYVGARGGTSIWFNGRIYSLIVRGAASTAAQISNTETWVNGKTKAY